MDPNQYIEENKNVYDDISAEFSSTRDYLWDDLKPFSKYVKNEDVILDVGCGNGRLYQLFEKNQVDYLGTDQSGELLKLARTRFPEARFEQAPFGRQPIGDESVDVVFSIAAFHHLPNDETRQKALTELWRVLKKNGRLIMSNWNLKNDWVRKKIEEGKYELSDADPSHVKIPWRNGAQQVFGWRHYWLITTEQMTKLLTRVGFEIEEYYYTSDATGRTDIENGLNLVFIARK